MIDVYNLSNPTFVLPEGVRDRIRWQGKDNVYWRLSGGLAKWNAKLAQPEVNSRDAADYPFAWATLPDQPDAVLTWWEGRLNQARRDSGLADLGPNLSLVGPGEAYFRSLTQDGKPTLKERMRPAPLPGGRIALIRQGKEERGFHQLHEAFQGAKDGDILEIRADATLPLADTRKDSGQLTLRAAPGYRPVLGKGVLYVHPGTTLAVEGLAFGKEARIGTGGLGDAPPMKPGRVSRIASCSFESSTISTISLKCLLQGADGSPGEVVRCLIQGETWFVQVEGVQVRFRECLFLNSLGSAVLGATPLGTYEMDRCIVSRSWIPARRPLLEQNAGKPAPAGYRWTVRNTLFESVEYLVLNPPTEWTGEKNLYRIVYTWVISHTTVNGLKQWWALPGVKETGSVEGDPWMFDAASWRVAPGAVPDGVGPDVSQIARPAPAPAGRKKGE